MENGTIVYAGGIIEALKMSNKQFLDNTLKAFDDKIENFLGYILTISNGDDKFEMLVVYDNGPTNHVKPNTYGKMFTSGRDWNLDSCKPVSYSFDIKDKETVIKNLGFNIEPAVIEMDSITIDGDKYLIIKE